MDHVYSNWDASRLGDAELNRELQRIFQHLLLASGGDVERALSWLKQIGERYSLFREGFGLDEFRRRLEREGDVQADSRGVLRLTPRGEIRLRRDSLARIFSGLTRTGPGEHRTRHPGPGTSERLSETRPYQFGDGVAEVDWQGSLKNALRRQGLGGFGFLERDLEVFETEAGTSCATVIAIDISHSMTLYGEDRITPAKQVSLALVELIRTRYPKDEVFVVVFGDRAREISIPQIPYLMNGPFHTNTREGLELALQILSRTKHPNKQIFMVTDGKPSALTEDGRIYKNPMGLDRKIVNKTLEMAAVLRRKNVSVTTFMLTDDPYLVGFVEDFTQLNKGRAYYSQADQLGAFLFVDYVRNRRRFVN